jgi:hypothetical protein
MPALIKAINSSAKEQDTTKLYFGPKSILQNLERISKGVE